MSILALDLGKFKTVFCDYNPINGEHEFGKVNTTPKEIHDLLVAREPQTVTLEVCTVAGWIFDIAEALGIKTEAANPMHDAWRWKNVKKKTDKEDALKLAKLSAMGQLPTVYMTRKDVREKRALIKYRQRLVSHRTTIKNTIRGNKLLRNLLIEICWVSLGSNKWARDTYKKLLRGSTSRKKIAITALARKLVVRCWAMLRDEQDWNDNIKKNVA